MVHELTNKTFGYLVALEKDGKKGDYIAWKCLCYCGNTTTVSSNSLVRGLTRSCGCMQRKKPLPRPRSPSKEKYAHLYYGAKTRAKKLGIEFSLKLGELDIPETCPVLGIPMEKSTTGKREDGSPSLDRLDNSKGYTPDNVKVISWRANKLKNNSSIEELEAIVDYMKRNTRQQEN